MRIARMCGQAAPGQRGRVQRFGAVTPEQPVFHVSFPRRPFRPFGGRASLWAEDRNPHVLQCAALGARAAGSTKLSGGADVSAAMTGGTSSARFPNRNRKPRRDAPEDKWTALLS